MFIYAIALRACWWAARDAQRPAVRGGTMLAGDQRVLARADAGGEFHQDSARHPDAALR